ncbi:MAG: hypothetical protein WBO36_07100 [Saprospiraceae bacterium]
MYYSHRRSNDLLIISEPFSLLAIEGDENTKKKLSFSEVNKGKKIIPDISIYKALKLCLLNSTHILGAGKAILSGFSTVKDAMNDDVFDTWIDGLMSEIDGSLTMEIDEGIKKVFGQNDISRLANPFIEYHWSSITLNFTTRIKIRAIPLIEKFVNKFEKIPDKMCYVFAAYLRFSIPDMQIGDQYFVTINNTEFLIKIQINFTKKY